MCTFTWYVNLLYSKSTDLELQIVHGDAFLEKVRVEIREQEVLTIHDRSQSQIQLRAWASVGPCRRQTWISSRLFMPN